MRKWARRHQAVVWTALAAAAVLLVVLSGSIGWVARDAAARRAETERLVTSALEESASWQEQRRLLEALSAARRAEGLLAGADVDEALRQRVRTRLADLELLDRLENIRLEKATAAKDGHFDWQGADLLYEQTFRDAGLDVEALPAQEAGQRIAASTVAAELAAVLDRWALVRLGRQGHKDSRWKDLLRIARVADPDAGRTRVRDAFERRDRQALLALASSEEVFDLAPATLHVLGYALRAEMEPRTQVEVFLRKAQRRYPNDFWLNHNLGSFFYDMQPPQAEEAVRFYAVAAALRPDSPGARNNLALALYSKGLLDEAIAEYRAALQLKKDSAITRTNLGIALKDKGLLDEAIAEHREAIRIKKDFADAYSNLGNALHVKGLLHDKGLLDDAIAAFYEAIRLNKHDASYRTNLGATLRDKGLLDEAIAAHHEALRINKDFHEAHHNLAVALYGKGQIDEAIEAFRQAIRIKKEDAAAHNGLGVALATKGQMNKAIAEFREAISIKKDFAEAYVNLGKALHGDEAIAACREAIRINKDYAPAYNSLGVALAAMGRLDEAIAEYRKAIQIKKDYADAYSNLGNALHAKGLLDDAIAAYGQAIRLNKDDASYHNNLGLALSVKGLLSEAIAEYHQAIRMKRDYAEPHYNLGIALSIMGRLDEAVAASRQAIQIKKDFAEAHGHLGCVLRQQGEFREALKELRRAHELGSQNPNWPYPTLELMRECERLVELDEHLPDFVSRKAQPASPKERIELAEMCLRKKLNRAAVRFYEDAFADPKTTKDARAGHRYNAACAAALAGCGQGKDADKPDAKELARLRQQALDWLRADLDAWGRLLNKEPDMARPILVQQMRHWLADTDFVGVRGPQALSQLPEAERKLWQRLWDDVANMLARAQGKTTPEKK
jgi:tetratricopeptide (TPR) repeat protein